MFNRSKLKIKALESTIEYKNNVIEGLKKELEGWRQAYVTDAAAASFVIDFNNLDIFSIERISAHDKMETIIGYWGDHVEDGIKIKKAKEWRLYINDKMHEKLVCKYEEHHGKRKK